VRRTGNKKQQLWIGFIFFLVPTIGFADQAEPKPVAVASSDGVRDYTPEGFTRQPSFVDNAGLTNKNEHAFLFYADAAVLPPALMFGYRFGLFYWWEMGFDVGGDYGVFQSLLHFKMENMKTRKSEFFFWVFTFKTGYKYHSVDMGDNLYFDDNSWVYDFQNAFAFRFGQKKDKAIYLTTRFYIDQDLRSAGLQTDYYFMPGILGFETVIGKYGNFFVDAGAAWSINGMETPDKGVLYEGDWFPIMKLGFAVRTGDRTAIYYTRETKHLSSFKQNR
jgi:hypothetical protein